MSAEVRFRTAQDRYFESADRARFHWTTTDTGFAPVEDALLLPRLADFPFPCLELGCGEGTNLVRLAGRGDPVGIDRYVPKLRFARTVVPSARLVAADATQSGL